MSANCLSCMGNKHEKCSTFECSCFVYNDEHNHPSKRGLCNVCQRGKHTGCNMEVCLCSLDRCRGSYQPQPQNDVINHPSHYTRGKIEVWDFIIDQGLSYCCGTVVKYLCRAGYKDPNKHVEDLKKARAYLDREIARISNGSAS